MNKITEAVQNKQGVFKGSRIEIPDTTRADLPIFFKEMGFKVGVEIGCYKGEYTHVLASTGLTIYTVDPWRAYPDYDQNINNFQKRQDFLFGHASRSLAPLENVTIIRKTSMEAIADFPDESIDFVYIDGHHGFKYVAEDIWEWEKKVKKGGIISGHDYARGNKPPRDPYTLHTKYVVDAYMQACGIKEWYIVGRIDKVEGEKRDIWKSWFYIKQ